MIEQEDFHTPRWTVGVIAKATGGNVHTIRNWIQKGLITGPHNNPEVRAIGIPTLFTTNAALQIAVMVAMNQDGISAEFASKAGTKFAHTGHGPSEHLDGASRSVGGVYADPYTWLVACPSTARIEIVRSKDLEAAIHRAGGPYVSQVCVLNLDFIHGSIPSRLFAANGMRG